ncbi:hypothetical protein L1987_22169 [Smallanthus sonchifolius]|uniref:Uncharacterized protein n=1 Tax=Smallanthus sonchifolius TaxID=185202 RepID=A0ACB9IFW3_9ASTR|nr:hypothetical protein L1987_22169 [Smallanthus sonchifolius]
MDRLLVMNSGIRAEGLEEITGGDGIVRSCKNAKGVRVGNGTSGDEYVLANMSQELGSSRYVGEFSGSFTRTTSSRLLRSSRDNCPRTINI